MTTTPQLQAILKDSAYKLTQFSPVQIQALENSIIIKQIRDKATPYVVCLVRAKEIKLTPEEAVRQLYLMVLMQDLSYPINRIAIEYGVTFGRETKRADICIFDKDRPTVPYILVELKKPKLKDGKEQLKSYCNATGAPMGVWTNGDLISYYHRKDPNYFEEISHIPDATQKLSVLFNEKFTLEELIEKNRKNTKSLRDRILEMEDEVLANAGVDVFEECFKLIFIKLYDEWESGRNRQRFLKFRNTGTEQELKDNIQVLFDAAKKKWRGVFSDDAEIELSFSHLPVCVSYLQDVKLFNSNLEVIDEAFEYLIGKSSKGEKGQYFTPRYVIDMCVKMLNPQAHETLIDTAAGSAGFTMHSIFHVWRQIMDAQGLTASNLFTLERKPTACDDYVQEKVFAIDFDEKAVRVARTLNLIAGDGQTNVLHLNTLDYERWNETVAVNKWQKTYFEGWFKFLELAQKKNDYHNFNFDILMANPPFAGDIKESRILAKYELGKKDNGKYQNNVGRDILFIERNLSFLKSGGRMAVVLPQGRFNNSSDKQIREFIAQHCRILAVVGLHGNVFKPHTGTKTSVLFVQKWDAVLCPQVDDYPIFFATMQEPSKDNSGDKIYVTNADGSPVLDSHEHLIVKHDLFNHDGLTQDGIAEAFIEFAKKENLSFFDLDLPGFKNLEGLYATPFNEMKYRAFLEKLEISEVMLSYVLAKNDIFRFDSNYFQQKFLLEESVIRNKKYITLKNIDVDIKSFGAYSLNNEVTYLDKGVPFIRGVNMKKGRISFSDMIYIDERANSLLWKSEVKPEMILLSMSGTIGDVAIASKSWSYPINSNQDIAKIDTQGKINAYFLYAFLMSKFGQNYLKREARGSVQQHVFLSQIEQFEVPVFSENLDKSIQNVVEKSDDLLIRSESYYSQAENLLLNAVGMTDFSPSTKNTNEKSFKDSFLATGRLDAEYYQPKYEEMMAHIAAQNHSTLAALVTIQKSIEPGSDAYSEDEEGLPFLRVADYNKFGITEPQKKLSLSFVAENIEKLMELKPKAGAVLHLTVRDKNKVLPDYLTLVLNSKLIKMQSERDAGGSIILHWRISEIENVIVPIVDMTIQKQIADLVKQSFSLKATSEQLLETAKRAVEIAIETNEQTAMDYLNS